MGLSGAPGGGEPHHVGPCVRGRLGSGDPASPGTHLMSIEVHDGGFGDTLHSVKQELARAGEGRGEDPPGPEGAAPQGPREVTGGLGAPPCLWETPGRQEVRVAQRSLCVSAAGTPLPAAPGAPSCHSCLLTGLGPKAASSGKPFLPLPSPPARSPGISRSKRPGSAAPSSPSVPKPCADRSRGDHANSQPEPRCGCWGSVGF